MMVKIHFHPEDYKPKDWGKFKDKALASISNEIDDQIEQLVSDAILGFLESAEFEKEATNYCRDQGWQELE